MTRVRMTLMRTVRNGVVISLLAAAIAVAASAVAQSDAPSGGAAITSHTSADTKVVPNLDPDFAVLLIPDPQFYAMQPSGAPYNAIFHSAVANKAAVNLKAIVSTGDNVDNMNATQMAVARNAWQIATAADFAIVLTVGNHDCDALVAVPYVSYVGDRSSTLWYKTFHDLVHIRGGSLTCSSPTMHY